MNYNVLLLYFEHHSNSNANKLSKIITQEIGWLQIVKQILILFERKNMHPLIVDFISEAASRMYNTTRRKYSFQSVYFYLKHENNSIRQYIPKAKMRKKTKFDAK